MSGFFGTSSATSTSSNNSPGDPSKDLQLANGPDDSTSHLAFSPVSDHLAVASWDKKVRIYEVTEQGTNSGKAAFEHEGPVMGCDWSKVR
jgi:mRNA export factor